LRWLGEIDVPVLISIGTADPTVTPQMAAQMHAAAVNTSAELIEIKGGTHYFEGQPELLDEALDALAGWIELQVAA
jgi:pimeloyl-ACP methyl ester carboxylesterase